MGDRGHGFRLNQACKDIGSIKIRMAFKGSFLSPHNKDVFARVGFTRLKIEDICQIVNFK